LHHERVRLPEVTPVQHNTKSRLVALLLVGFGLAVAWPTAAEAQRRRPVRAPAVRSVVVVGAVGYPYSRFYGPWGRVGYPWGWWSPLGYPYPVVGRDQVTASIRLDIEPREAAVYVDGYLAGRVDDFDGIFQRLRLRPGNHEIVIFLEGYRTVRQDLYFGPGSDQKVSYVLEPLGAGELAEPPSEPAAPPEAPFDEPALFPPGRAPEPGTAPAVQMPQSRFGTLSIRVQPAGAAVVVDGEPWLAPAGQDRMILELTEGRHHVEISEPGFARYAEDVLIRAGRTLSLNVSLLGGDAGDR